MTPQIATDPSQSKRLLDCGVNPDTADFVWMEDNPPRLTLRTEIIEDGNPYILAPSWSLSALLALLPSPLYEKNRKQWSLQISPAPHSEAWVIAYADFHTSLYQTNGATVIEAAVRMIETLVNKRIKLNKQ